MVSETRAVKTYPLNSRRLTAMIVHRIAAALELPKAPLSDARQMVEGSLGEGRDVESAQSYGLEMSMECFWRYTSR